MRVLVAIKHSKLGSFRDENKEATGLKGVTAGMHNDVLAGSKEHPCSLCSAMQHVPNGILWLKG